MRRRSRTSAKLFVADVVVGVGVIACVAAGWSMRLRGEPAAVEPALSAADAVALRFPYELEEANPPAAHPVDDAATPDPNETLALFDPNPTYPTIPSNAEVPPTTPQAADPDAAPPVPSPPVTSGTSELAAAVRRSNVRQGAVLSDGQIAGIKRRLKLTPEQQQMWPPVEVALRSLSYPKKSESVRNNIDTRSREVQELTSAAYPLVMSFSDDQKRELHDIAHVAGLEQLVPKF